MGSWRRLTIVGAGVALVVLAAFAGSAAASAPAATTGPTTSLGASTATVGGTVTPGGQSTSWWIEYGTSSSYGSKTGSRSAGSGSAGVSVSADLSALKAGTTYHYRLVASNGSGTNHGADAVFTTYVPPNAVTGTGSSISASAATLNGSVDANGRSTTYWFEYGTSTSYGTRTSTQSAGSATSPQSESIRISGLQAGRTYHFRIVASSDAGTNAGKDSSFTTSAAPWVETEDVDAATPTTAKLKAKVSPNGLSTTWWFQYGTSTHYSWKTSSHGAGSGGSARWVAETVRRLRPATTYHYRIVAQNSSSRTYGDDRTFMTVGAPAAQTGAAQNVGPDTAVLTGSLYTHGRSTSWWFDYGTTTGYGRSTGSRGAGSRAGTQSVSLSLTGLTPGTTYHYRLVTRSDAGTNRGADVAFTTSGVTLSVVARQVVFGGRIRLSGIVPTQQPGEQVIVFSQPYGGGSFHSVTTVLTGAGGVWSYLARPGIGTAYEASWRGGTTAPVAIGVHPRIVLTRLRTGRFVVRVSGGRGFPHRLVQLQRRVGTHWKQVRRVRLGVRSRAEFRATLPKGRSTLRVTFSVNQAGAGFLGGTSRLLVVTLKR